MEDQQALQKRKKLPVICATCHSQAVYAIRGVDRVLVYCDSCGARIFAYYDDERHPAETPPEEEDPLLIRQVERELLHQVSRPAAALYEHLRRYIRQHGYAPTLREMQQAFHWGSASTALYHLGRLEAAGLIERDFGEARGIRLPHAA